MIWTAWDVLAKTIGAIFRLSVGAGIALVMFTGCAAQALKNSGGLGTRFVSVDGQPEPVPSEWVATPEGKLAHSIKTPNPLPKNSGYRREMTSEQYFEHLCKTEAGEHIFSAVENVEGLFLVRPLMRPSDDDLKDRYKLEAPEIERTFQLWDPHPEQRAETFVAPPSRLYSFVEEPREASTTAKPYVRSFGYQKGVAPMKSEFASELRSHYGLIWRGVKRFNDRELAIAGSEWIILDLATNEVLALQRNYARTGFS